MQTVKMKERQERGRGRGRERWNCYWEDIDLSYLIRSTAPFSEHM